VQRRQSLPIHTINLDFTKYWKHVWSWVRARVYETYDSDRILMPLEKLQVEFWLYFCDQPCCINNASVWYRRLYPMPQLSPDRPNVYVRGEFCDRFRIFAFSSINWWSSWTPSTSCKTRNKLLRWELPRCEGSYRDQRRDLNPESQLLPLYYQLDDILRCPHPLYLGELQNGLPTREIDRTPVQENAEELGVIVVNLLNFDILQSFESLIIFWNHQRSNEFQAIK